MQKIVNWFKNYWYYYKWQVIISAFVLFVVIFCVVQCGSQEKYDVFITYAGPDNISNQIDDVTSAVRAVYTTKEEKNSRGISVRNLLWVNSDLAEEYISNSVSEKDEDLLDYKFMCFNGKVKCIFTCSERY